jgi:hypothetical protein
MVTEDDAKKLWCHIDASHCIGCACMAWRWGVDFGSNPREFGYCGLAGTPEILRTDTKRV